MREIKFRAWDKQNNKWMDRLRIGFGLNPQGYLVFTPNENIELQQYTGLKDKNGKEIYEGDIIASCDRYGRVDMPMVVEWIEVEARYTMWYPKEHFEVIGNIYENPELLKG